MRKITFFFKALYTTGFIFCSLFSSAQIISTLAGGVLGNNVSSASMGVNPWGVVADKSGNIYVSDWANYVVRKINLSTGIMTVIAGNGSEGYSGDGGQATNAQLFGPSGIALDTSGNIYFADYYNNSVRMVNRSTGIITTVAGNGIAGFSGDNGPATAAEMYWPYGIAADDSAIYIADVANDRIRKVYKSTGIIITMAGKGAGPFGGDGAPATDAYLNSPGGVCLDKLGNVYIADYNNSRIRKVTKSTGIITTCAGSFTSGFGGDGGQATSAELAGPEGVGIDTAGNIYVGDCFNNRIRKINTATGVITTVSGNGNGGYSGNGGPATNAELNLPSAIAFDSANNLFIVDSRNYVIREVKAINNNIYTVAGNNSPGYNGDGIPAVNAQIYEPTGLVLDPSGNIYIADNNNFRIRKINIMGIISTIAGNNSAGFKGDGTPATNALLSYPNDVALDKNNNLYIDDWENSKIRKINAHDTIITIAGMGFYGYSGDGGPATAAKFNSPEGVSVDTAGNVFIADMQNNMIREIKVSTGIISRVAGNTTYGFGGDGGLATAASAELARPQKVVFDNLNNMYIADANNNRVRMVNASTGIITTIAGDGTQGFSGDGGTATAAELNQPSGVAIDPAGRLFVTDQYNNRIRMIDLSTNIIYTVAGNGIQSYGGDGSSATAAELDLPNNVNFDIYGNMYIADMGNNRIRRVTAPLGINPITQSSSSIIVYPNPNNGSFNLSIRNEELGINASVEIYNMLGEKIYSNPLNINNFPQGSIRTTLNIDLPCKSAGVYLYRILSETGEQISEGKFIIE